MPHFSRKILILLFSMCLFATLSGKLHVGDHDDEDQNVLLSRKKAKSQDKDNGQCTAGNKKCSDNQKATPEMMDETSEYIVGFLNQFVEDVSEGRLDFAKLAKKISNMLIHGSLPGGNPAIASGFKLFKTMSKAMGLWEKKLKTKGINLKDAMDELHEVVNQVVPGLVIAIQHADRKCRKQALCRSARTAADTSSEMPQSVSLFLSNGAATYLDMMEKSKKNDWAKIVECCSTEDKALYKTCSAQYMDKEDCSSEKLLQKTMLQPISYSQVEYLKTLLPKFN